MDETTRFTGSTSYTLSTRINKVYGTRKTVVFKARRVCVCLEYYCTSRKTNAGDLEMLEGTKEFSMGICFTWNFRDAAVASSCPTVEDHSRDKFPESCSSRSRTYLGPKISALNISHVPEISIRNSRHDASKCTRTCTSVTVCMRQFRSSFSYCIYYMYIHVATASNMYNSNWKSVLSTFVSINPPGYHLSLWTFGSISPTHLTQPNRCLYNTCDIPIQTVTTSWKIVSCVQRLYLWHKILIIF